MSVQTRVPLSKDERKALKARQRAGMTGAAALDDFADDVAGVLHVGEGEKAYFDKVRLGQKFGGDLSAGRAAPASGGARSPTCVVARHARRLDDETQSTVSACAVSRSCIRMPTAPRRTHGLDGAA